MAATCATVLCHKQAAVHFRATARNTAAYVATCHKTEAEMGSKSTKAYAKTGKSINVKKKNNNCIKAR